jgi:hypothetical protein
MAAINARTFVSLSYGEVKNLKVFLESKGDLWWANSVTHTAASFAHCKTAYLEQSDAQKHIDDEADRFTQYNTKTKEIL